METKLILTETHPPDSGSPQATIQQAVSDWLTKELSK